MTEICKLVGKIIAKGNIEALMAALNKVDFERLSNSVGESMPLSKNLKVLYSNKTASC